MKPSLLHLLSCKFIDLIVNINGPSFILVPIIRTYAKFYRANLDEASKNIHEYKSFDQFFTRELKPGLRTINGEIISPVDGLLVDVGEVSGTTDIKGTLLNIPTLLGDSSLVDIFNEGTYFNFYLAPGDYHRIHAPVAGEIVSVTRIPGTLYSVKPNAGARSVLSINRRVVIHLKTGLGTIAVVLIGALNVGKIELVTSKIGHNFKVGDHLGTFHLGSSVVVIFPSNVKFHEQQTSRKVLMGESLQV